MAALWNLPVLFVCENNLYGIGTAIERSTAVIHQHKRVSGYGIEAAETDGQDIEKVYEAALVAVHHVRSGKGPYFLELMTYRYRGHSMSDSRGYRSREEEELWKQRDPIFILRDRLIAENAMTMADYETIEKEVDHYIENEVIKFAEESPEPKVEELEKYVLAERETQRRWLTGQA
jgi:pyruvate dehydrogenase E1 component alpha subunit